MMVHAVRAAGPGRGRAAATSAKGRPVVKRPPACGGIPAASRARPGR